jgi:hypothetical protein
MRAPAALVSPLLLLKPVAPFPDQNAPLLRLGRVVRLSGLHLRPGAALADWEALHRLPSIEEIAEAAQGEDQRPAPQGKSWTLAGAAGSSQPPSIGMGRVLQLRSDWTSRHGHLVARIDASPSVPLPPAQAARRRNQTVRSQAGLRRGRGAGHPADASEAQICASPSREARPRAGCGRPASPVR